MKCCPPKAELLIRNLLDISSHVNKVKFCARCVKSVLSFFPFFPSLWILDPRSITVTLTYPSLQIWAHTCTHKHTHTRKLNTTNILAATFVDLDSYTTRKLRKLNLHLTKPREALWSRPLQRSNACNREKFRLWNLICTVKPDIISPFFSLAVHSLAYTWAFPVTQALDPCTVTSCFLWERQRAP